MRYLFIILLGFISFGSIGQEEAKTSLSEKLEKYKIQPVAAMQIWSTYTMGTEVFSNNAYQEAGDRLNIELHRTRFGFKGQPYERMKFNFLGAFDFVGRDVLAGTVGGSNNGGNPGIRLWNAFVQFKASNDESFNITAGYFHPQLAREGITPALRVPSMEKSWGQNYLRRHLLGVGHGRRSGVNIGGFFDFGKSGFKYDVGVFTPFIGAFGDNSQGLAASPMVTGRFAFNIGDAESKTYTTGYKANYFGKRNGVTIALVGTYQGETDIFDENYSLGGDLLLNYGQFNLDGQWNQLYRSKEINGVITTTSEANAAVGHVRLSYNFGLKSGRYLTPYVMLMQFNGPLENQGEALAIGGFAGEDQDLSFGFNYFFNQNLFLTLSYTARSGDAGDIGEGFTGNNYFFQSGVGAYKRGDWLGLGLAAIL